MDRLRPTSSFVIVLVPLYLALGASAVASARSGAPRHPVAAHHYVITRTSQIAPAVLKRLREGFGPAGLQGSTGLRSLAGATGPAGSTGSTGPVGVSGSTGRPGVNGSTGPAGVSGSTGPAGASGPTGPAGSTAASGPTGSTGPTGLKGLEGATGSTGPAGGKGLTGSTGPGGVEGAKGAAGSTGATGPAGPSVLSKLTEAEGKEAPLDAGHLENFSVAECPEGQAAVSGGAFATPTVDDLSGSYMTESRRGWYAQAHVADTAAPGTGGVVAYVYCANTGQAIAARAPHGAGRARRRPGFALYPAR